MTVPSAPAAAFGLYPAEDFRIGTGAQAAGTLQRQAAWYFQDELVAVPAPGCPQAECAPGVRPFADLRRFAAQPAPHTRPPLVWVGSPDTLRHVRCTPDATGVATPDGVLPLRLTPKIAMNRSYFDATSAAYFAARACTLRGTRGVDGFVARTWWPDDLQLGPAPPPPRALPVAGDPAASLRALMREMPHGGAQDPSAAFTLWQRNAGADWRDRAVLALVVNGAQGDDDEAHGGHFAIATGRIADDGAIGDWLVDNFYSLDVESEKGILAAPVPLACYQGDLNSGQSWYRPTYVVAAVLDDPRAALRVQDALHRLWLQFWRHQFAYYHPTANCTSISLDTLRALGWAIPRAGPSHRVLPWLGLPALALRERSLAKAKLAFDYLTAERTRLLPAVAAEAALQSLWSLAHGDLGGQGALGRELAQDLAAIAFLRIPQFPSSRAWGDAPAVSTAEYMARTPKDPAQLQIIPLPPRPFPDALRDADLLPPPLHPSDIAVRAWAAAGLGALAWLVFRS